MPEIALSWEIEMERKQSKLWAWSIPALILLAMSLNACTSQATVIESPALEAAQTRNIKVYESPT